MPTCQPNPTLAILAIPFISGDFGSTQRCHFAITASTPAITRKDYARKRYCQKAEHLLTRSSRERIDMRACALYSALLTKVSRIFSLFHDACLSSHSRALHLNMDARRTRRSRTISEHSPNSPCSTAETALPSTKHLDLPTYKRSSIKALDSLLYQYNAHNTAHLPPLHAL